MTTSIRIYFQAIKFKKFAFEDGLLLFAVTVFCAVTVLCFITIPNMYNLLDLILLGAGDEVLFDVINKIPTVSREANAMAMLNWVVLFAIKFAYLLFFRKLVFRLKKIENWWWCVVVFMVSVESL